ITSTSYGVRTEQSHYVCSIDDGTLASQSTSSSSSTASSTTSSSSTDSTSSSSSTSTPAPQSSSSKTAVIVGCTVGGLAVIGLLLVFFFRRRLGRAPLLQNQNGKTEGILDIDIPPREPLYGKSQIHRRDPSGPSASEYTYFPPSSSSSWSPVPDRLPEQGYTAARLRDVRQRELDERIQSAQREMDNLKSVRNIRSASEMASPSAGPSRSTPEVASLRNELQQLRDQMGHLQAQRQSDWAQGLSNEPLPPAYTRH
ncbi:hypothetical protein M378DRAFT_9773, partial [Amanita muscaria Koide BX008]